MDSYANKKYFNKPFDKDTQVKLDIFEKYFGK